MRAHEADRSARSDARRVRRGVVGALRRAAARAGDAAHLPVGLGAARATVPRGGAPARRHAAHDRPLPRGARGCRRGRRDDPQDVHDARQRLLVCRRVAARRSQPRASGTEAAGSERRALRSSPSRSRSRRCAAALVARGREPALLVLLAYAGLRPGEALALEWRHVRERTLVIEQAVSDGRVKALEEPPPPSGPAPRAAARGSRAAPRALPGPVIARSDGGFWRETDWRNWRRRVLPSRRRGRRAARRPSHTTSATRSPRC